VKSNAQLVLVDIDQNNLDNLASKLVSVVDKGNMLLIKTDVSDCKDVVKMTKSAIESFGKIDVLFNNAGINKRIPPLDVIFEDWRKIMSINLDGMFFVAQAVAREMVKRRKGKIINTASMSDLLLAKILMTE